MRKVLFIILILIVAIVLFGIIANKIFLVDTFLGYPTKIGLKCTGSPYRAGEAWTSDGEYIISPPISPPIWEPSRVELIQTTLFGTRCVE